MAQPPYPGFPPYPPGDKRNAAWEKAMREHNDAVREANHRFEKKVLLTCVLILIGIAAHCFLK